MTITQSKLGDTVDDHTHRVGPHNNWNSSQ